MYRLKQLLVLHWRIRKLVTQQSEVHARLAAMNIMTDLDCSVGLKVNLLGGTLVSVAIYAPTPQK
jgi:hypothetical protein